MSRRVPRDLTPGAANRRCLILALALAALTLGVAQAGAQPASPSHGLPHAEQAPAAPEENPIRSALVSLPLAGALGAALAFRPQRRGTPPHTASVIQTQIILAMVGATVMVVVGASLARAFGIVGAASLVRYRAKVDDPKDAGVMLACLGIGLASGVGVYAVATVSAVVILVVVLALESMEPDSRKAFLLKVKANEPAQLRKSIEDVLRRNDVKYELRGTTKEDLTYSALLPLNKHTDRLTNALLVLGNADGISVEWSDKKPQEVL
jgi:uncharacterized membrane protein YhiD involved in acid resistance